MEGGGAGAGFNIRNGIIIAHIVRSGIVVKGMDLLRRPRGTK